MKNNMNRQINIYYIANGEPRKDKVLTTPETHCKDLNDLIMLLSKRYKVISIQCITINNVDE